VILLDTNVLSEARRHAEGRADPPAAAWFNRQDPQDFWISAIVLLQVEIGIRRTERRDPPQGRILRAWLTTILDKTLSGRVLPVTFDISMRAAGFHVPNPAPFADSLIAATAAEHGLVVATRNGADFAFPGVRVVDPWAG
jgi:toxin FitB